MGRNAAGLGYVVDLGYVVFFGAGVTTGPALVLVDRLVDVAADFLALAVADVELIVNCGTAAAAVAWPSRDEETARVTEARCGRPESRMLLTAPTPISPTTTTAPRYLLPNRPLSLGRDFGLDIAFGRGADSSQKTQPSGAGGHEGSGYQSSGSFQPSAGTGQPGGGL